nr:MAG TPA: hypothetical protein [Caudoviricetes sp.]
MDIDDFKALLIHSFHFYLCKLVQKLVWCL